MPNRLQMMQTTEQNIQEIMERARKQLDQFIDDEHPAVEKYHSIKALVCFMLANHIAASSTDEEWEKPL